MPLRSVEAATRDDAIAAAREQFGPTARVVGVRRVRSGGVLGFFATERYVAEVDPDQPVRGGGPSSPAGAERPGDGDGRDPVAELAGLLAGGPTEPAPPTYSRTSVARVGPDRPAPSDDPWSSAARPGTGGAALRPATAAAARYEPPRPRTPRWENATAPAHDPDPRASVSSRAGGPAAGRSGSLAPRAGATSTPAGPSLAAVLSARSQRPEPGRDEATAPAAAPARLRAGDVAPAPAPWTFAAALAAGQDPSAEPVHDDAPGSGESSAPSPFTAALARMVAGDRDVRQAVEEALGEQVAPRDPGAPPRPARTGAGTAARTSRTGAGHQEEETGTVQDDLSAGVPSETAPAEAPAWEPRAAAPAPASPREEAIAEVLREALARGHSDESLTSILRRVLDGASPQVALDVEPLPMAPVAPVELPVADLDPLVEVRTFADEPFVPAAPFVPAEPFVAEPFVAEPFVAERIVAEPIVVEPIVVEPVAVEPEPLAVEQVRVVEPVAVEPVPAVAEVVPEPVAVEPAVLEPPVLEPAAVEPVVLEVVVPEPVIVEPVVEPSGLWSEPFSMWGEPVIPAVPTPTVQTPTVPTPAEQTAAITVVAEEAPAEADAPAEPAAEISLVAPAEQVAEGPAAVVAEVAQVAVPVVDELPVEVPAEPAWADIVLHAPTPAPAEPVAEEPVHAEAVAPAALARTASDPAPPPLDSTAVLPALSLLPPLSSSSGRRSGLPPVPPSPVRSGASRAAAATMATVVRFPRETPDERTAAPTPARTREVMARLRSLGIPARLLTASFGSDVESRGLYAALTRALGAGLPVAPELPLGPGEVLFVVGPGVETLRAARALAASLRLDPDRVLWATRGELASLAPKSARVTTVEAAIDRRQEASTSGTPTIVAVDAPLRTDAWWTTQLLAVWGPEAVWAVVDATRKPEDVEPWLAGLPRVDALVVQDTDLSADPAAVLDRVDVPVALLDGAPATPHRWASLLCERLDAHLG